MVLRMREYQPSTHCFLHERADPCLFGGSQLLQSEDDRPHGAFVEVRRVAEAERRVPRLELLRGLDEAGVRAVLGVRGHPVPGPRREGWCAGFDDRMKPLGHGAIRFPHLGDLREHGAFPVRLVRARAAARGCFPLLEVLLHRGSFLVRESLELLVERGGALGRLLRVLFWAHRNLLKRCLIVVQAKFSPGIKGTHYHRREYLRGSCLSRTEGAGETAPPESRFGRRPGRQWPEDQLSPLQNATIADMPAKPRPGAWPPTIGRHRAGKPWLVEALGPNYSSSPRWRSRSPAESREDRHDGQESEPPAEQNSPPPRAKRRLAWPAQIRDGTTRALVSESDGKGSCQPRAGSQRPTWARMSS